MKQPKKTTEANRGFIRDNYQNMTYAEIGNILGITPQAVWHQVKLMGLPKKLNKWRRKPMPEVAKVGRYEAEEDGIILANPDATCQEIACKLGRSIKSVEHRRRTLKRRGAEHRKGAYSDADDKIILENPNMTLQELVNSLGRKKISVRDHRTYLRKRKSGTRTDFVDVPIPERTVINAGGWVVRWNFDANKIRIVGAVTAY